MSNVPDKPASAESDADRIASVRKKVQEWIKTTQQQQDGKEIAKDESNAEDAVPPKKRPLKGKGAAAQAPPPPPPPEHEDADDASEPPSAAERTKAKAKRTPPAEESAPPRKQRVRVTPRPEALQELVRRSVADYYDEFVHEKTKQKLEKQGEQTSQALSEASKFFAF